MSEYIYNNQPSVSIPRSVFSRSHNYKTTIEGNYLYPVYVDEVLPGDSVKISVNIFARMATQIVPLLDNAYLDVFAFFVPRRLVWSNWQKFMGEQENPGDSIDYLVPKCVSQESFTGTDSGFAAKSLFDYMGMPPGVEDTWLDACYPRAYNLIYNEWFRDENLVDSVTVNKGDGPDYSGEYALQKRSKGRDYFTSCLPWPQKGPASTVSLVGDLTTTTTTTIASDGLFQMSGFSPYNKRYTIMSSGSPAGVRSLHARDNDHEEDLPLIYSNGLKATSVSETSMDSQAGASINQLRMAYQFQKFLERSGRFGSRYIEVLRAHFGVISPDARLQRPEFLGSFSTKVNIQAIAQNSATNDDSPQANLAAIGTMAGSSKPITKSFVEHGIIMFIANLRGDVNYDQGVPRIFQRRTRNDFFWPEYAHLGEQVVLNREIFAQGDSVKDDDGNVIDDKVFGYIPRYDEYRFAKNEITGELRGSYATSLNYWTLTEHFENLPGLNKTFIEQNTPFERAQAVSSDPVFLVDIWFDSKWARPMPTFGVPGWVDHF